MATVPRNLTPEDMAAIQRALNAGTWSGGGDSGPNWQPNSEASLNGRNYMPEYDYSSGGPVVSGWRGYDFDPTTVKDNADLNGTLYDVYDTSGVRTGEGTWTGLHKDSWLDTFIPLAMMAAPFALPALGVGSGAGAGAYGASAGALESGIVGSGAGGATAGTTFAGGIAPAAGGSGLLSTLGSGAASALGGASTLGALLGPAATVLGAAAGAKGQKTSQTSERKTDPRVDPYLFGDGTNPGLLGYVQQRLARDMAPGGLLGYDEMITKGRGLMGAPVAGNGFNRLTGR